MFKQFTRRVAYHTGQPWTFLVVVAAMLVWAATGPFVGFSQTWQLIANTVTTLVTCAMVFVLQSSSNLDTAEIKAMLREMAEDIDEVDEQRAAERVAEEEKP
jgi:low affinity Fe/Cu permease